MSPSNSANIKPGKYRHYKGKDYEVMEVATHTETEEKLVIYRSLYGDFGLWARPLSMFVESVEVNGEVVPRFRFIEAHWESRSN